jgi:hydroxyacylglutathione hydrolase
MPPVIQPIHLKSYRVNCYLLVSGNAYYLIDTGAPKSRSAVERALDGSGCKPGNLKLIVLTHADVDHAGNAAYLRERFAAKIAVHRGEAGVAEKGPMSLSREGRSLLPRLVLPLFKLSKADRFKPDLYIEDGDDLSAYGVEARIIRLPGHSNGSIGILTSEGDPSADTGLALFCGDLLTNTDRPALNTLMDNPAQGRASLEKLRSMPIKTVYPGHGSPFLLELLK